MLFNIAMLSSAQSTLHSISFSLWNSGNTRSLRRRRRQRKAGPLSGFWLWGLATCCSSIVAHTWLVLPVQNRTQSSKISKLMQFAFVEGEKMMSSTHPFPKGKVGTQFTCGRYKHFECLKGSPRGRRVNFGGQYRHFGGHAVRFVKYNAITCLELPTCLCSLTKLFDWDLQKRNYWRVCETATFSRLRLNGKFLFLTFAIAN